MRFRAVAIGFSLMLFQAISSLTNAQTIEAGVPTIRLSGVLQPLDTDAAPVVEVGEDFSASFKLAGIDGSPLPSSDDVNIQFNCWPSMARRNQRPRSPTVRSAFLG
jgi:hypothetical protein